jgi:hypothetical protein
MSKILNPFENVEAHYNTKLIGASYENKIILDLGASNGDSAEYFLNNGAKFVIAVEGNFNFQGRNVFAELLENSKLFNGKIIPIFMWIDNPKQIENLIIAYKPDIVKSDIEGAEIHLFNIRDEVWQLVPEYIVETHEGYLHDDSNKIMYLKCEKNKYKIMTDTCIVAHVIYTKRE